MISLKKAKSFAFLSEVTLKSEVFVKCHTYSKDVK